MTAIFCCCIRTERVRKLFITSSILNKFSCGKVQILCRRSQRMNIEECKVIHCSFLLFLSVLEEEWLATKRDEVSVFNLMRIN